MPFALLFDKKHKVLLVRFGRALTRQALEAMVQAAREFAAVHGNCDGIVDFSAVEKLDIDVAYLRAYGASPRVMAGPNAFSSRPTMRCSASPGCTACISRTARARSPWWCATCRQPATSWA
jgi:hypothetical protein